jgi:hypothetical protein
MGELYVCRGFPNPRQRVLNVTPDLCVGRSKTVDRVASPAIYGEQSRTKGGEELPETHSTVLSKVEERKL